MKMRLQGAFGQQKGSRLVFFGFGAVVNQKKASPDPFHESMVRKVYTAKISGPYQLFLRVLFLLGPFFFSVNGAEGAIRTYYTTFKRNRPFRGFFFNFSHG